jgi:hypothetical protein
MHALSACAADEALATRDAAVDITISSGGETIDAVSRGAKQYPAYLECVENVVKSAARDMKLARTRRYRCKLELQ